MKDDLKELMNKLSKDKILSVKRSKIDLDMKLVFEYYINHEPDSDFVSKYIKYHGVNYNLKIAIIYYIKVVLHKLAKVRMDETYVYIEI
jgi:hypothetical protein